MLVERSLEVCLDRDEREKRRLLFNLFHFGWNTQDKTKRKRDVYVARRRYRVV